MLLKAQFAASERLISPRNLFAEALASFHLENTKWIVR